MVSRRLAAPLRTLNVFCFGIAALVACSAGPAPGSSPTPAESVAASSEGALSIPWKGWESLSGGLVTDPVIVSASTYGRDVFATGPDGNLYTRHYDGLQWSPGGGWWTGLGNGGHALGAPAAVASGGSISVFARDSVTHHLVGIYFNSQTWGTWTDFGGDLAPGRPAVAVTPNGTTNVFATFNDKTVKWLPWLGPYIYRPYVWTDLSGSVLYEPAAVSWSGSNHLAVFVAGGDHELYTRWSDDGGATWVPGGGWWQNLGGSVAATPTAVVWGYTNVDVFASAVDTTVNQLSMTNFGGTLSAWRSTGHRAFRDPQDGVAAPTALSNTAGHIDLFVQGEERGLWHSAVDRTSSTFAPMGPWDELTSCFRTTGTAGVTSIDNSNSFDVVVTGYAASGNTSVWHGTTAGGFYGIGAASPPACPCGLDGQTCCKDDACAAVPGNRCIVNGAARTCTTCGKPGQKCCPGIGMYCDDGDTCNNGTCECGKLNEACCKVGQECASGTTCDANRCVACGGKNQDCCTNDACSTGYTCVTAAHPARCSCGDVDQPCCPGSTCNNGFTCKSTGYCARPADPAPTCAAIGQHCGTSDGPYCCGAGSGVLCDFGTCKACIAHGSPCVDNAGSCCSWQDTCVVDQTSGGSACDIADEPAPGK